METSNPLTYDPLPRGASSMEPEEILLGTVLPAVGITHCHNTTVPLRDKRPFDTTSRDASEYAMRIFSNEMRGNVPLNSNSLDDDGTNAHGLPPTFPVTIKFDNIRVSVKVYASTHKVSKLDSLRAFLGIAGRGPMETKEILHGISGVVKPCTLLAVMGASGAGKSTLLNALSNRIVCTNGKVTYNDFPPNQDVSGFVQQTDLFLKNLTVHEHLESQLRLRLPTSFNKTMRNLREDTLLNNIHLKKCKDTVIGPPGNMGGISGGERKRLNVASELSTLPSLIFADEPTTGLDSFMAESVVSVLRKMADEGKTVVATIHQPSSKIFELFDTLLLLSEGNVVYFGDRLGCVEWFKLLGCVCPPYTNPADFLMKILNLPESSNERDVKLKELEGWAALWKEKGEAFLADWAKSGRTKFLRVTQSIVDDVQREASIMLRSPNRDSSINIVERESHFGDGAVQKKLSRCLSAMPEEKAKVVAKKPKLNWFKQLWILYKRASQSNKRDRHLVHARATQTLILGLIFGFLFFRLDWSFSDSMARVGGTYCLLMNQSMVGAFAVTHVFVEEKAIILREYESGLLSPSAYIIAKMMADAPIQIVFPTVFAILVFWLMNLQYLFTRFLVCWVIILLVSNAAMSIGYFASAIADEMEFAAIVCNLTVLPLTIFGGLMVKLDESPRWLSWIQWFSFVRYGANAALVELFDGMYLHKDNMQISGLDFVKMRLTFTKDYFSLSMCMLAVLLIVYRIIACIAFTIKLRRSKENA